ncbi:MAG: M1 family aminopeptidase [Phycisphaerae bacterium]
MNLDSRRPTGVCRLLATLLATCCVTAGIAQTPATPPDATLHHNRELGACGDYVGCGKACALRERFLAGLPIYDPAGDDIASREAFGETDVLHYQLEFEIFPATERITGTNRILVRSLTNGLTQFTIRLRSNYTITSAAINDITPINPANIAAVGSYGRQIPLDRAYNAGEEFTISIAYDGIAVARGFGSINFDTTSGNPMIASLSQPYFAATWWPAKDGDFAEAGDNSDKATMEMSIIVPNSLRAVSNGLLQGIDALPSSRARYRWATNIPTASYLFCFAASIYNTWTVNYNHPGGTMPVEFNLFPASDTPANRAAWERCIAMLEAFRPVYGEYPFIAEKYGMYQFLFGGGMEHQTNTGQGTFVESVTAHELAHQWWGDNVTCRYWNDIWLNEGWATYGEAIWQERAPGSSGLPALHAAMASRKPSNTVLAETVYVDDPADFPRIFDGNLSYRKGGWVLHMLRKILGDATFFETLAVWRATYEGSGGSTDDFIAVAETVSERELNWFFDRWIYGIGWPTYSYGSNSVVINGQRYLRLYVTQTQAGSIGAITMPIDIRVDDANGSTTYTIWNDATTEHYVIPIPLAPTAVVLDEFNWILNGGRNPVAYVAGPPKVVQVSPAPGSVFGATSGPTQVSATFSANVTTNSASMTLRRDGIVVTPASQGYNNVTFTRTLTFAAPLSPGSYELTVADTVTGGGIRLDGEVADALASSSLPSGDGQPLGNAVVRFTVSPPCPFDLNGDGQIGLTDLSVVLSNFGIASGATASQGDFNGDGAVDLTDLSSLLAVFGANCA